MTTLELEYFLPVDIEKLEESIKAFGYNVDDFHFETRNPDKRFIPELWITHNQTQYYLRVDYATALSEKWIFRYTPGPHGVKQAKEEAPKKGPDFIHIDDFFKHWLGKIKPQLDSIARRKNSSQQIKENTVYSPDRIEIIIDENDVSEVTPEVVQGLNHFTQWLLPQAEKEIGKTITKEQYDDLKSRVEDLESKVNAPKPQKNIVGRLFKAVMEHEALSFLGHSLKEYGFSPTWEVIKYYFPGLGN